jgi:hypothetical protein
MVRVVGRRRYGMMGPLAPRLELVSGMVVPVIGGVASGTGVVGGTMVVVGGSAGCWNGTVAVGGTVVAVGGNPGAGAI